MVLRYNLQSLPSMTFHGLDYNLALAGMEHDIPGQLQDNDLNTCLIRYTKAYIASDLLTHSRCDIDISLLMNAASEFV